MLSHYRQDKPKQNKKQNKRKGRKRTRDTTSYQLGQKEDERRELCYKHH